MRYFALWEEIERKDIWVDKTMDISGDRTIIKTGKLGDWVIEDAMVLGVAKDKIKIIPLSDCGGKGGCGKCNLCGPKDKKNTLSYKIENLNSVKPGEQIKLKRFIINEAIAAGTLFGIPIFFAFLTQLLWHVLSPENADSFYAVIVTLASGFFGVLTVFVIEQIIKIVYPARVE